MTDAELIKILAALGWGAFGFIGGAIITLIVAIAYQAQIFYILDKTLGRLIDKWL